MLSHPFCRFEPFRRELAAFTVKRKTRPRRVLPGPREGRRRPLDAVSEPVLWIRLSP